MRMPTPLALTRKSRMPTREKSREAARPESAAIVAYGEPGWDGWARVYRTGVTRGEATGLRLALAGALLLGLVRAGVIVVEAVGDAGLRGGGFEDEDVGASLEAVALADGDVVADAGLHLDLAQLALGPLEHEHALAGDEGLGLELGVVALEAEAVAGADGDELGAVGDVGRGEDDLIAPGLVDPAADAVEGEGALVEAGQLDHTRDDACWRGGASTRPRSELRAPRGYGAAWSWERGARHSGQSFGCAAQSPRMNWAASSGEMSPRFTAYLATAPARAHCSPTNSSTER